MLKSDIIKVLLILASFISGCQHTEYHRYAIINFPRVATLKEKPKPTYLKDGILYYHPLDLATLLHRALYDYSKEVLAHSDKSPKAKTLKKRIDTLADFFVHTDLRQQNKKLGFSVWIYPFDHLDYPAGWHSALANGFIGTALYGGYLVTSKKEYRQVAIEAFNAFRYSYTEGGQAFIEEDKIWFLELAHPSIKPRLFVMNGFQYALASLSFIIKYESQFQNLFEQGIKTLIQESAKYLTKNNFWSSYCRLDDNQMQDYHMLVMMLYDVLYNQTHADQLKEYRDIYQERYLHWNKTYTVIKKDSKGYWMKTIKCVYGMPNPLKNGEYPVHIRVITKKGKIIKERLSFKPREDFSKYNEPVKSHYIHERPRDIPVVSAEYFFPIREKIVLEFYFITYKVYDTAYEMTLFEIDTSNLNNEGVYYFINNKQVNNFFTDYQEVDVFALVHDDTASIIVPDNVKHWQNENGEHVFAVEGNQTQIIDLFVAFKKPIDPTILPYVLFSMKTSQKIQGLTVDVYTTGETVYSRYLTTSDPSYRKYAQNNYDQQFYTYSFMFPGVSGFVNAPIRLIKIAVVYNNGRIYWSDFCLCNDLLAGFFGIDRLKSFLQYE